MIHNQMHLIYVSERLIFLMENCFMRKCRFYNKLEIGKTKTKTFNFPMYNTEGSVVTDCIFRGLKIKI